MRAFGSVAVLHAWCLVLALASRIAIDARGTTSRSDTFRSEDMTELTYGQHAKQKDSHLPPRHDKGWVLVRGEGYQLDALSMRRDGILHEGTVNTMHDALLLRARTLDGVEFPTVEQLAPSTVWPPELGVLIRRSLLVHAAHSLLSEGSSLDVTLTAIVKKAVLGTNRVGLDEKTRLQQMKPPRFSQGDAGSGSFEPCGKNTIPKTDLNCTGHYNE